MWGQRLGRKEEKIDEAVFGCVRERRREGHGERDEVRGREKSSNSNCNVRYLKLHSFSSPVFFRVGGGGHLRAEELRNKLPYKVVMANKKLQEAIKLCRLGRYSNVSLCATPFKLHVN